MDIFNFKSAVTAVLTFEFEVSTLTRTFIFTIHDQWFTEKPNLHKLIFAYHSRILDTSGNF